jgi:hypothetical protein
VKGDVEDLCNRSPRSAQKILEVGYDIPFGQLVPDEGVHRASLGEEVILRLDQDDRGLLGINLHLSLTFFSDQTMSQPAPGSSLYRSTTQAKSLAPEALTTTPIGASTRAIMIQRPDERNRGEPAYISVVPARSGPFAHHRSVLAGEPRHRRVDSTGLWAFTGYRGERGGSCVSYVGTSEGAGRRWWAAVTGRYALYKAIKLTKHATTLSRRA